jgi:hypothetical protein
MNVQLTLPVPKQTTIWALRLSVKAQCKLNWAERAVECAALNECRTGADYLLWLAHWWLGVSGKRCMYASRAHPPCCPPGEIAMAFQMFVFLFIVVVVVCFLLVVVVVVVVLVVCPASGESNEDQLQHVCLV